jgi:hypothetical protein
MVAPRGVHVPFNVPRIHHNITKKRSCDLHGWERQSQSRLPKGKELPRNEKNSSLGYIIYPIAGPPNGVSVDMGPPTPYSPRES